MKRRREERGEGREEGGRTVGGGGREVRPLTTDLVVEGKCKKESRQDGEF